MQSKTNVLLLILFVTLSQNQNASASLRFVKNEPNHFDFADQRALPPAFGAGEFTFEIWIKPDTSFPVGFTDRGTINQLNAWSNVDLAPYSAGNWWFPGNFLLDGHTRPDGFTPDKTREGTFSLQFYGGGRLRWMFADDGDVVPVGKVWTVEAYPASSTPSLLDGKWHNVNCVRRWSGTTKSQLELWIDGKLIATQVIPQRVNMRQFWDSLPHPRNPKYVGGWCWGSEVMTAWNYYFTQYEDYKGLLAEIRFWDRAKPAEEVRANWMKPVKGNEKGLVGYLPLNENGGAIARDRVDSGRVITLHNSTPQSWAIDEPFASTETSATQQPRQLEKREGIQKRALAALASQQSESGHDCANATTTYDENMCLSKVSDETQEAFNVFYKDLFSLLGNDDRTKLDNAQAQWIDYRKFSCDAVGEMFRGGTIRRSREMRCKIALTRSRMRDLADLYDLTLHN